MRFEITQLRKVIFHKRRILDLLQIPFSIPFWFRHLVHISRDVKLRPNTKSKQISILEQTIMNYSHFIPSRLQIIDFPEFVVKSGTKNYLSEKKSSYLRSLFDIEKSDKGTGHEYYRIYSLILNEILSNHSSIQILEIGIGTNNLDVKSNMGVDGKPGASLRAFKSYDPRISVLGADVDRRILFDEERISCYFVDQESRQSLHELLQTAGNCQLLIDDGLHNLEANTNSYLEFVMKSPAGAWIVIEDIEISELSISNWALIAELMSHRADSYLLKTKKCLMFISKIRV